MVYRDKGSLGAKPKGYDATIKRAVKKPSLGWVRFQEAGGLAQKDSKGKEFIQ